MAAEDDLRIIAEQETKPVFDRFDEDLRPPCGPIRSDK